MLPPLFYMAHNSLFTKFLKNAARSYFRDDFNANIVIVPKDSLLAHTQYKNQPTTKILLYKLKSKHIYWKWRTFF